MAELEAESDLKELNKQKIIQYNKYLIKNSNCEKELEEMKYNNIKICKRKDGRWCARPTIDGKQKSLYGISQRECYNKLREFLKSNKKTNNKIVCSQNISYGEWLEQWINLYKLGQIKQSSLTNIYSIINHHLEELKNINITKITPVMLLKVIGKPKGQRAKQLIYTVLSDSFDKAIKMEVIKKNPMQNITKPKYTAPETKSMSLKLEEDFIRIAEENDGVYLLLCLFQGLRIGEALALTKNDIRENSVIINKSKNKNGCITTPKTKTSIREIPLFARTKNLLENQNNYFESNTSTEIRRFESIMKELNMSKYSTKTLRHTFATRAMEAGIEPKIVQKWLGHSSIDITMKIYTHIKHDFEKESTNKLNNFFDTKFDTKK